MGPQSRANNPVPPGFQSKSTPNLPTLRSLDFDLTPTSSTKAPPGAAETLPRQPTNPLSPALTTSPSEPASVEDNADTAFDSSFKLDPSSSSTSSEDGLDDDISTLPQKRPLYTHSSRSYSHLPPSTSQLFPPFYNRPPTPLPPSPSLTSLLRPTFSAQTSRPTTPDSSDLETSSTRGPNSTSTSITRTLSHPHPVPRASPKVPTYEYYGFALYTLSSLSFFLYLLWSYLPSPFLHQLGIHYYPNRWWALAIPAWLVVLVVYIYVALASYNTQYLTTKMGGIENLVDSAGKIAIVGKDGKLLRERRFGGQSQGQARGKRGGGGGHSRHSSYSGADKIKMGMLMKETEGVDWKDLWSEGTDAVMDVPIGGVCEILYGEGREGHAFHDG